MTTAAGRMPPGVTTRADRMISGLPLPAAGLEGSL
jgi:hypothetical protein